MTDEKRTYEAMFLVDAGNPDFKAASEPILNVLTRSEAEVLSIKPWEERRLAYEIKGRRRGLYVLTYFKVHPSRGPEIEHESELDERILRALILRRDNLGDQEIHADTPATVATHRPAAPSAAPTAAPSAAPRRDADATEDQTPHEAQDKKSEEATGPGEQQGPDDGSPRPEASENADDA